MSNQEPGKISRRSILATSLGASLGATGIFSSNLAEAAAALRGKKVLVAIGEFSEGLETYYTVFRFMEEGIKPVVAAGQVKRLHMVVHDFDPKYSNYIEMPGYCIKTDVAYKDIDPSQYDGMLIPGGRGPEEMRLYPDALRVTRYFMNNNLPLGAICHGPQVLWSAGSVKGRKIAACGSIKADVEAAGATFVDEPAVVDGSLVTSRGWPDLPYFLPAFLKVLSQKG
ncbi:MAG: DJ-1/PfpI family protein [Pirellulales bacterium]|nr:DJ-1/PfpI family protein [Pirellulales bacterium]